MIPRLLSSSPSALCALKVVFGDGAEGGAPGAGGDGGDGEAGAAPGAVSAISEEAWVEPNVVADPSRGGAGEWGRPGRGGDEDEDEELQLGGVRGKVRCGAVRSID